MDDIKDHKGQLDALRRERAQLIAQIRASQETIERSQALLKRIDEILARAGQTP
jgi:FtsZ-binding cell division protein ZapB